MSEVIYIRVPADLKEDAQAMADRMMVSLSDIGRMALAQFVRPAPGTKERTDGK